MISYNKKQIILIIVLFESKNHSFMLLNCLTFSNVIHIKKWTKNVTTFFTVAKYT